MTNEITTSVTKHHRRSYNYLGYRSSRELINSRQDQRAWIQFQFEHLELRLIKSKR